MRQVRGGGKKVCPGLKGAVAAAAFGAAAIAAWASSAAIQPWWALEIKLTVRGNYEILANGVTYPGEFAWSGFWRGTAVRDEFDLILHEMEAGTLEWRLDESPSGASPARPEEVRPPVLHVHYVIRNGPRFDFDLDAEGPTVPVCLPGHGLPLPLPSSAEAALRLPELAYETGLNRGSNRVFLEADDVGDEPAARTFAWTWKNIRWVPLPGGAIRILTSHRVETVVSIRPGDRDSLSLSPFFPL